MVAEIIKSWRESSSLTSNYQRNKQRLDSRFFQIIGIHLLITAAIISILLLTGEADSVESTLDRSEIWDNTYFIISFFTLLWIPLDEFLLRAYFHARKFLWYSGAAAALFFVATLLLKAELQQQLLAAGLLLFIGSLAASKRLYDKALYCLIGSALFYAGMRMFLFSEELPMPLSVTCLLAIQLFSSGLCTGITHLRHGFWPAVLHRVVFHVLLLLLLMLAYWWSS
ncbi:MAG: hypothetical protein ACXIT9_11135 [Nitritalea sp.]